MIQQDLFDQAARELPVERLARYPHEPGARRTDTSQEAADHIRPWARGLRGLVLRCLQELGPQTPEEVSINTAKSLYALRPRFSELHKMRLIIDTGERRPAVSGRGRHAIVWRVA